MAVEESELSMKTKTKRVTRKTKTRANGSLPAPNGHYDLRLYVAGQTPKSIRAFSNLQAMCEEHLKGHYRIEVIHPRLSPQLFGQPKGES